MFRCLLVLLSTLVVSLSALDPNFGSEVKKIQKKYIKKGANWCKDLPSNCKGKSFKDLEGLGVDRDYLDFIAYQYCKRHSDARIAIIWPRVTADKYGSIQELLEKEGICGYFKSFKLKNRGPKLLQQVMPEKVESLDKMLHRYFPDDWSEYPMSIFVMRFDDLENAKEAKRNIRKLCGIGHFSIHIPDTHTETMDIARLLLNNNSIHYINYSKPLKTPKLDRWMKIYSKLVKKNHISRDDICIDGSAIMGVYGIRDIGDFDYMCVVPYDNRGFGHLDLHNEARVQLNFDVADLIYNPKNYFYVNNLKIGSLDSIKAFKKRRKRPKDIRDVKKIKAFCR